MIGDRGQITQLADDEIIRAVVLGQAILGRGARGGLGQGVPALAKGLIPRADHRAQTIM